MGLASRLVVPLTLTISKSAALTPLIIGFVVQLAAFGHQLVAEPYVLWRDNLLASASQAVTLQTIFFAVALELGDPKSLDSAVSRNLLFGANAITLFALVAISFLEVIIIPLRRRTRQLCPAFWSAIARNAPMLVRRTAGSDDALLARASAVSQGRTPASASGSVLDDTSDRDPSADSRGFKNYAKLSTDSGSVLYQSRENDSTIFVSSKRGSVALGDLRSN